MARVEIIDLFGSGKIILAKNLAGIDGTTLLEDWERTRSGATIPVGRGLGTLGYDLASLLQHVQHVACSKDEQVGHPVVCDWSFVTDRSWASLRLGSEFEPYDGVH